MLSSAQNAQSQMLTYIQDPTEVVFPEIFFSSKDFSEKNGSNLPTLMPPEFVFGRIARSPIAMILADAKLNSLFVFALNFMTVVFACQKDWLSNARPLSQEYQ